MPLAFAKHFLQVAKARHSYRLRPALARSGKGPLTARHSGAMRSIESGISCNYR
jgi:hypothetical protein